MVHALLNPKRERRPHEERLKAQAVAVFQSVDGGHEDVATTVVHLGEIANRLKGRGSGVTLPESHAVLDRLLENQRVKVLDVQRDAFALAVAAAKRVGIDGADALAQLVMREQLDTKEIYTFNRKHFRGFVVLPAEDASPDATVSPAP